MPAHFEPIAAANGINLHPDLLLSAPGIAGVTLQSVGVGTKTMQSPKTMAMVLRINPTFLSVWNHWISTNRYTSSSSSLRAGFQVCRFHLFAGKLSKYMAWKYRNHKPTRQLNHEPTGVLDIARFSCQQNTQEKYPEMQRKGWLGFVHVFTSKKMHRWIFITSFGLFLP